MNDILGALKEYCTLLGADQQLVPDSAAHRRLPLFLRERYQSIRAHLYGRSMYLLMHEQRENPTPGEVESHLKLIRQHLGADVAFVFEGLPSFARNRLLKKRVPFIVPHRQMFLPPLVIDLREVHGAPRPLASTISMPAQLLLLHHLQKRTNHPYSLTEWAGILGYSKMSITRASQYLVDAALVEARRGKTTLRFREKGRSLWERAQAGLRSPVQREGYYYLPNVRPKSLLEAGFSALANYTDLSAGPQPIYATQRAFLRTQPHLEPVPYSDVGTAVIQQWWYSPTILAEGNRSVDRLSLYLSLRDSADERVQLALQKLLDEMKW